jgi:hypothetical protein
MSQYYYLISSLPYLRQGGEPPLRSVDFLAQCAAQLNPTEVSCFVDVGLIPRVTAASPVEARWNEYETYLRNALVRIRATRQHRDPTVYSRLEHSAFGGIEAAVRDAYNRDPIRLEEQLDRLRWQFLDDLVVGHEFDFTAVFVYRVKLLLLEKRSGLDAATGQRRLDEAVAAKLQTMQLTAGPAVGLAT